MNIALVLVFTKLIWLTSNQASQLASGKLSFLSYTIAKVALSVLLLSLASIKTVRENRRTVFSLFAAVVAVETTSYFNQSAAARSASIAWYLLYFGMTPIFLLAAVGANRSLKNFLFAALSIASLIAVSFGFSVAVEIVGLALAGLAAYSIDIVDAVEMPKRDKSVHTSRQLVGFPLVLQTTSLGPKDWYEVKSCKR